MICWIYYLTLAVKLAWNLEVFHRVIIAIQILSEKSTVFDIHVLLTIFQSFSKSLLLHCTISAHVNFEIKLPDILDIFLYKYTAF